MLKDGPGTAEGHAAGRICSLSTAFSCLLPNFFPPLFFCGWENIFDADNKKHWRATACGKYIDKRHAPTTNTAARPRQKQCAKVAGRQRERKGVQCGQRSLIVDEQKVPHPQK